jgi:hypothetical protein
MFGRKGSGANMVPIQLTTDEGVFICNMDEDDMEKISVKESGTFIVIHCAIRLDATLEGQYEIHRTKRIETSSIEACQPFQKKVRRSSARS